MSIYERIRQCVWRYVTLACKHSRRDTRREYKTMNVR